MTSRRSPPPVRRWPAARAITLLAVALGRFRQAETPTTQSAQDLEEGISWRGGDSDLIDTVRDGTPFLARLRLVALGRCSCSEADVLVEHWESRVRGQPLTPVPVDPSSIVSPSDQPHLVRRGDRLWVSSPMELRQRVGFLDGATGRFHPSTELDQAWQLAPVSRG